MTTAKQDPEPDSFLASLRQMSQDMNAAEAYGQAFADGYARASEDFRRARADGYARGRADTLDKAIAAVRGLAPHLNYRTASGDYASARVDIDDAIAALEALR